MARTSSTWSPHPDHVILPHVRHRTGLHIDPILPASTGASVIAVAAAENLGTFRDTVQALLDVRFWVALDIDEDGRVLAGHDDLGSLQLVEIAPDGTTTALTDLPGRCQGRYVPGRRHVLVEHDAGGDEKWQISLLDLTRGKRPAQLADLIPVVSDPEHMNVLHDVTKTSLIYSTNRRNEVDMDIVVRDLDSGEEREVDPATVAETLRSR
jgi:hypothetical protein